MSQFARQGSQVLLQDLPQVEVDEVGEEAWPELQDKLVKRLRFQLLTLISSPPMPSSARKIWLKRQLQVRRSVRTQLHLQPNQMFQ